MSLPFANITGFKRNTSACAPSVSQQDFEAGYIKIKVYFGFSEDLVFPFGFNNTVVVSGLHDACTEMCKPAKTRHCCSCALATTACSTCAVLYNNLHSCL